MNLKCFCNIDIYISGLDTKDYPTYPTYPEWLIIDSRGSRSEVWLTRSGKCLTAHAGKVICLLCSSSEIIFFLHLADGHIINPVINHGTIGSRQTVTPWVRTFLWVHDYISRLTGVHNDRLTWMGNSGQLVWIYQSKNTRLLWCDKLPSQSQRFVISPAIKIKDLASAVLEIGF